MSPCLSQTLSAAFASFAAGFILGAIALARLEDWWSGRPAPPTDRYERLGAGPCE